MNTIIGVIFILIPLASFFIYMWYNSIKILINDGECGLLIISSAITFIPLGAYFLSIK